MLFHIEPRNIKKLGFVCLITSSKMNKNQFYKVKINSKLFKGQLNYGEILFKEG